MKREATKIATYFILFTAEPIFDFVVSVMIGFGMRSAL
jgi:hypothetical protein